MDAATKSIEAIREGVKRGEYVEIKGVPLFPVHDEYDMRRYRMDGGKQVENADFGKVKERFDKARLEKIAAKCNDRAKKSGDLAPFGPGHTIPGASVPETQQPPVYGFFADYTVGEFGPGKETGILATAYARKEHESAVKTGFPRRSIELVPGSEEFIDWVALLRRAPAMDIGILAYQRECPWVDQENYQPVFGPGGVPLAGCYSPDGKLRYSLDHQEPPMDTPPVVPADKALFDGLIRYMREQGVIAPEKPPEKKPEEKPPVGPPEDDKIRMQREQDAIRYSRLETDFTALKDELAKERYQRTQAECERQVIQLEGEGFQLDRAAEVSRMVPLDDKGRAAHVETIKRFYRQAPVGQSWLPTVGAEKGDDLYDNLPKERFESAQRYMREETSQGRPCTWPEAVTKVSAN